MGGRARRGARAGFIDYARFLFVADGEKARRELGFEAAVTAAATR